MNEEKIIGEVVEVVEVANETIQENAGDFVTWFDRHITWENIFRVFGTLFILFAIWVVFRFIKRAIKKAPEGKFIAVHSTLFLKITTYIYYIAIVLYVLNVFGIKLSALLGAAGIAGVAVGFAAQTSMSNLISGLFVLSEQVVKIGDTITVGDTTGIVDSIDALSVKVHTFDNQLVRIPNSTIIDSNMVNYSYFSIRRFTFNVSIAYETDMEKALEALRKVPALCPTVLRTPEPAAFFDGFGDSGIHMVLAVYFGRDDLRQTKNEVYIAIKKVFDEAGISIPFHQIDVHLVN